MTIRIRERFLAVVRAARERARLVAVVVAAVGVMLCVLGGVVLLWPMDTAPYLGSRGSCQMVDRSGRVLWAFLNDEEQWCFPVALDQVSPRLIQATIAVEDQRFRIHPGIDLAAIARACWQNMRGGRVVSGASTLTMQVVKQTDRPPRTIRGKCAQAVQSVRLDARVDKDRILEAYLNGAPYGLNLVGCEAAAHRYYGKPAIELTISEAALLAGLPKAPTSLMPLRNLRGVLNRRNHVLRRMRDEGFITEDEYRAARAEPMSATWHEFTMLAPHLAMRMRESAPDAHELRTTLDRSIQANTEMHVRTALRYYPGEIANAAAIVVDVETASILARVGSGDFFDESSAGQVDACLAPRSPGSTLKPLVYGLAMRNDLVYPCETLCDDITDYGRYNPENFDSGYHGLVSAEDALRHSLNVPAVTVLQRLGVGEFHAFLPSAGVTSVRESAGHYGLGLTLGNCEVRLQDLTAAYCMLAGLGEYRPLAFDSAAPMADGKRCLPRDVCVKMFDMLEQTLPEEFQHSLVPKGKAAPRVCWKTGTSAGYRDAWTFVFNRHYVVGVWMGNSDNAASKWLVGADSALPLAAKIFRSLEPKNIPAWPDSSQDMVDVDVCAVSGLPVSGWCPHTRVEALPRSQYLHRICDMHHPATGPDAGPDGDGVVERWPGAALRWDLANVKDPVIQDDPLAGNPVRRESLTILNPTNRAQYVLTSEPNADRIRLRASMESAASLHWYMNGRYLGKSLPGAPVFLNLSPGQHKLACMTDNGTLDTVAFEVTEPESSPNLDSRPESTS